MPNHAPRHPPSPMGTDSWEWPMWLPYAVGKRGVQRSPRALTGINPGTLLLVCAPSSQSSSGNAPRMLRRMGCGLEVRNPETRIDSAGCSVMAA